MFFLIKQISEEHAFITLKVKLTLSIINMVMLKISKNSVIHFIPPRKLDFLNKDFHSFIDRSSILFKNYPYTCFIFFIRLQL